VLAYFLSRLIPASLELHSVTWETSVSPEREMAHPLEGIEGGKSHMVRFPVSDSSANSELIRFRQHHLHPGAHTSRGFLSGRPSPDAQFRIESRKRKDAEAKARSMRALTGCNSELKGT
jgi:hypothetical protein